MPTSETTLADLLISALYNNSEERYERKEMSYRAFYQRQLDEMVALLASEIGNIDFGKDRVTHKGTVLMELSPTWKGQISVTVDGLACEQAVLVGQDTKIYIRGPRHNRFGQLVIDIHPYDEDEQRKEFRWGGVRIATLHEIVSACFI